MIAEPAPSPITCIIVDDEDHSVKELESLLSSYGQIRIISKITNPHVAVQTILEYKPNLLFLDIQMPGLSGFEIVEALNQISFRPFVIFITAFDHYAVRAIRCAAFDFLLKPVDKAELAIAMERFLTRYKQKEQEINYNALIEQISGKKIRFNTTGGFVLIDPQNIIFIKADWNYSEVYLSKEKWEVVALNLGTIQEILPSRSFARINRSVIINLRYLEKVLRIKRRCILKKDGEIFEFKIPIMRIRDLEKLL